LWELFFRKWIVASVACATQQDVVNHSALIINGKQGVGKTTFIKSLIPNELKDYTYFGSIDPTNKDTTIQLSQCLFIVLDELVGLTKHNMSALKELIVV